ncbi:MAG: transporter related protein [Candidatus Eremiobacteraeota bacterium]|nr:transporter related protein [Candidatus Eremiobacteraeota bacterium]
MSARRYAWAALLLVPVIAAPFVHSQYLAVVLATIAIDCIAALGLAITLEKAGQPSLAQATFMAIGAYTTGLLELGAHWNMIPAVIAGVVVAGAAAYVIGAILLGLEGLYFALGTLSLVTAVVAILANAPWFGGAVGLDSLQRLQLGGMTTESSVMLVAWLLLLVGLVVGQVVDHGILGRGMRMLRESGKVTRSVGMDPAAIKRVAFAMSGAYAGLAGGLLTMLFGIVNPQLFSLATSIAIVAMVVVGGEALWGTVVGAVIMVGFGEITRYELQFAPVSMIGGINLILNGAILVVIMRVWPGGVSAISTLRRRGRVRVSDAAIAPLPLVGMGHAATETPSDERFALRATGIGHRFGGVTALTDVALTVRSGEVLAVIGPNGAGKTTLLSILGGFHELQRGMVELGDRSVGRLPAHERARLGIAATFQHMEVVQRMSVEENVLAAGRRRDVVRSAIEAVGLAEHPHDPVSTLSFGQQRMVELARAIARPSLPRVLLMDEPASGLSARERTLLGDVIKYFARSGTAVILVEHDVGFVARLADRILVLDHGVAIAEGPPEPILRAPNVVDAYIGKAMASR